MCGRYAMSLDPIALQRALNEQYQLEQTRISPGEEPNPRYNVSPTSNAPILRMDHRDHNKNNESSETGKQQDTPTLQWMSWGVIPFWAKERSTAAQYKTFNARLESIQEGGKIWKTIRGENNRCVIPIEGYYEWLHKPLSGNGGSKKVDKIPYYIKRKDGGLIFIAGMFSHVKLECEENPLGTFTMVTGPAPEGMKWLHSRMPIILEPGTKAWERWLGDEKWSENLGKECLKEYHQCEEHLEWYEVSRDVGKPQSEGAYLTKAVPEKKSIDTFFGNKKTSVKGEPVDIEKPKVSPIKSQAKTSSQSSPSTSPKKRRQSTLPLKRESSTGPGNIAERIHDEDQKAKKLKS